MSPSPGVTAETLAGLPNPFSNSQVGTAFEATPVDVTSIHREALDACLRLVAAVARGGHSESLLLYGEAGTGKTHLLHRLRRRLEEQQPDPPVFVAIRMETAPNLIWRHLQRHIADGLLATGALDRLLAAVPDRAELVRNYDLGTVLGHWRDRRHRREAAGWLRGDSLPEAAAHRLGLAEPQIEEEMLEERAKAIVVDLCRLAAPAPVVLCLDQVEALQSHAQDTAGIFAFGKLVTALRAHIPNLLVISCVQTSFIRDLDSVLREAERDRLMNATRHGLQPLTRPQARELLAARLESIPELRPADPASPAWWPLPEGLLGEIFSDRPLVPARKVLFRAREAFERARGNAEALPRQTGAEFLDTAWRERRAAALERNSFQMSDEILADGLPLLLAAQGYRLPDEADRPRGVTFAAERGGRRTAVAIANEPHLTSLANRLRRLLPVSERERVVLVRDSRLGISRTARASQERLATLEERGGRLIPVNPETLAALDALRRLLGEARAGDLSHQGESLPAEFVERWLFERLPPELTDLAAAFEPAAPAPAGLLQSLLAYVAEDPVTPVNRVAERLQLPAEEILHCARENPDQLGLLEGALPALFALVGEGV